MVCCAEQDSVRLLTVESCAPLAKMLAQHSAISSILAMVQGFAQVCFLGLLLIRSSADSVWR